MTLAPATRLFSVLLLMFLLEGSVKSCGPVNYGELSQEQTWELSGPATVSVESGRGPVQIERGPEGKVSVKMKFRIQAGDRAEALRLLERLQKDPPISRQGDKIALGDVSKYNLRGGILGSSLSIGYQLKVPDGTTLDVKTSSGDLSVQHVSGTLKADLGAGTANVKGFEGTLELKSTSGRLWLSDVRGQTKLESNSGPVSVEALRGDLSVETKSGPIEVDAEITSGAQWHFQTRSGDISLTLPSDSSFTIYGRSDSSKIKVDFPLTTTGLRGEWQIVAQVGVKPDARIEIITKSGNVQVARK